MAATDATLRALTLAALALPGLSPQVQAATGDDEASFQYGHYFEGPRNLFGIQSPYRPIEVDNLFASARVHPFERGYADFQYQQDTWSGATPIASAPLALAGNAIDALGAASPLIQGDSSLLYDTALTPYRLDLATGGYQPDRRLVHTIAQASPETRKQGDLSLGYEWDEAAVELAGGLSEEPDYHSAFASLGGRLDFNRKNTTLDLGLSYTHSLITAKIDPEASNYYDYSAFSRQIDTRYAWDGSPIRTLEDGREDWSTRVGLSQILSRTALIEAGLGFTRSTGYLENPYKVVNMVFVDASQEPLDLGIPGLPPVLIPDVRAALEQRPDIRNQWVFNTRYVQYFKPLDAALHLGYRFYTDDWGIDAHTFDADWRQPLGHGWTLTPRIRYYSQSAADFYRPYFLLGQAAPVTGELNRLDWNALPVRHFSSDHRLSGYGVLSGGLTVSKSLGKAVALEAGFEYYTHAGGLRLDGPGENRFADFDFIQYNAALRVNLEALQHLKAEPGGMSTHDHQGHQGGHASHHAAHGPAGVMFDHRISEAGGWMLGYRYMYGQQDGSMLRGTNPVDASTLIGKACPDRPCRYTPDSMAMQMHMLDIMYAPTDWLTLMLMPQFMDMDMELAPLDGAGSLDDVDSGHVHSGPRHHATGGIADTGLYALVGLFDRPGHQVQAGLGLSAPTGSVDLKIHRQREFIHYGMQTGSGTWDFRPSLSYAGLADRWFWGAQVNGIVRLERRNDAGFSFGDQLQSTAWGGYRLLDSLNATVRGVYTLQGSLRGAYNGPQDYSGPMDYPANYGGHYWDMGFGLDLTLPTGALAGHRLGVEWLQPLEDAVNGYQLERTGSLYATWSLPF